MPGEVNGKPMACTIAGVIRGMLADGTPVFKGMKSGDVDPRGELSYCSDRLGQGHRHRRRRAAGNFGIYGCFERRNGTKYIGGIGMRDEIKLTKLAKCAGCGAKVGAGILAQLLGDIRVRQDPKICSSALTRAMTHRFTRCRTNLALVQTVDFFPPIADDPYTFGPDRRDKCAVRRLRHGW